MTIHKKWSTLGKMATILAHELNWKIKEATSEIVIWEINHLEAYTAVWQRPSHEGGMLEYSEGVPNDLEINQTVRNLWAQDRASVERLYESLLSRKLDLAIEIATKAHQGQVDKSGVDYIKHPLMVMSFCEHLEAKIIAVLHDVLEDTTVTYEELVEAGIPVEFVECVHRLARPENVSYMGYIRSLIGHPLLEEVKMADLKHNMDLTRIPNPTQKDFDRVKKYEKAKAELSAS